MSSILRALKKLENDPRHQEESQHLENKFMPLADAGTQRPVSSIFMMVVGGGIVCGLVILAGWWFFSGKGQIQISKTPKISQADSKLAEISPAPSEVVNKTPEKTVAEKAEKLSLEVSETKKTVEHVRTTETAESELHITGKKDIPSAAKQTPEETVHALAIPDLKENEQSSLPAEKPFVASGSTQVPPVKTVEVEVPKLNDPDMKLQAVTWSRVPQKRIAVINNRILREGDIVSGYLINTINQDDIILNRNGIKSRLVFH